MRTRKIIFILCTLLVLLSMASVSASDLDDVAIQTSDDTIDDVIASDEGDFSNIGANSEDKVIQSSDDTSDEANIQGTVSSTNDNNTLGSSFTDLQAYINGADEGGVLVLDDDYSIDEGGHTLVIEKSLTIDGAGHSLTSDDSSTIICINAREKSVILKNITFWHGGSSDVGGAILNNRSSTTLTIIDCIFYFNCADAGGAVYSYGNLIVNGSTFEDSNATDGNGGAIHCEKDLHVSDSQFTDNWAGDLKLNDGIGGAIYTKGKCYVESCGFYTNLAKDGSAIYSCGDLIITGRTGGTVFTKNKASFSTIYGEKNVYINWDSDSNWTCAMQFNTHEGTGAIRCEGNLYAQLLYMYKNEAGRGPDLGVAIYCEGETHVNNSEFVENIYTPKAGYDFALYEAHGGAIWSNGKCYIDSCQFTGNFALKGGAIYACDDLRITGENNLFKDNQLDKEGKSTGISYDKDGGAIYCRGNLFVNNTDFINNSATIDGGAIYCEKECRLYNCEFNSNVLTGYIARCSYGGAICTDKLIIANNCSFYSNTANPSAGTDCYGGAIYIISKCNPEFISCIFDENACQMRGGAIYTDSENTNLKIINSSFYHNTVDVDGGAIYCKGKTTISGCEFRYDRAKGNSIYEGSFGGSVYSLESVTVEDSKFQNCHANNIGGAIYTKGEIKVSGSNFTNNTAKVDGGAIYADGKTTISNCIFKDNEATGEVSGVKSYGGAIRSNGFATLKNSTFDDNFAYNLGGAIYVNDGIDIINSSFSGNKVYVDGGAVYAEGKTYIYNSKFEENKATGKTSARSFGGAVRSNGDTTIDTCIFNDNFAYNNGGAVYSNKETTIKKSTFQRNEANDDGGAVYSEDDATVTDSMFEKNSVQGETARRAFGGGLCSYGEVTLTNTNFYDNYANNRGGAVFALKEIKIKECTFEKNYAQYYGGAVYTRTINTIVSNSIFNDNHVMENDGGAVYINNSCEPEFSSCTFKWNGAKDRGGAIYVDSKDAPLKLSSCTFIGNEAGQGGAVYTGTMAGRNTYSLFFNNEATSGDGGAIYINNNCDPKFISCRFEDNEAKDRGGALYLDSGHAELYLGYCTFVDNKAGNKGHSVFNSGFYEEIVQCWLGRNNPSLENEFKEWHAWPAADTDFTDFTPAYILIVPGWITTPYIGNTYNVTVEFLGAQYSYYDLLHSSAMFYGDKVIYSNEKVDINDMTAEVVFTDKNPTIKLKLDHQVVTLSPKVRDKNPSEVIITSCEDVKYPNALKVDYEIINWTGNATYVIIDEYSDAGDIVRQGKITNPKSTLTIENLNPGKYYIRIDNHQNYTTSASRALAHFTVYRLVSANVTADNVTYGNPTTITLRADYDGLYNVSVNGEDIEMEVANGICTRQVNFDIGEYQTHTRYIGNCTKFNCTEAVFTVGKGTNNIAVEVADVVYGSISYIQISADADGDYLACVNGTQYVVTVSNGIGGKALSLDAGNYFVNVSFDNDKYISNSPNATFNVFKADIDLVVAVFDVAYPGEIEAIVYASADGEYNLTINNDLIPISIRDNLAHFIYGTLDVGTYEANVSFAGNRNYNPAFNSTSFTVYPSDTYFKIAMISTEISYGDTPNVYHMLSTGATGTIRYYLNNVTFIAELDVSEDLTLPLLDVGTYLIVANYSGDRNFASAVDSLLFTVGPGLNSVVVSADNVTYGNESLIVVSADVDGSYQVDINGTIYNVTVEDGVGNITLALDAGSYYANVSYNNKNYNTTVQNTTFEVYKADIDLSIEVPEIVYPQDFKGTVRSNLDGKYNFTVDNYFTTILVDDGLGQFDLGLLDAGTYRVTASYSGDRNHNPALDTLLVTVRPGINNVVVSVENVTYGKDSLIMIYADVDGNYQVDVNGTTYNLIVRNGLANRTIRLNAGRYYANVTYNNRNYNTTVQNTTFEVYKADIDLVVIVFDEAYPQDVEAIVYASADGEYNLTINNNLTLISVNDNIAYFNKGTMDVGTYEASVSFAGNDNYNPAFNRTSFTVYPSGTLFEIDINSSRFIYGETATVTHILSEGATGTIKYFLADGTFLGELDVSENLILPVLDAGDYVLIANYSGDLNFISALDSLSFTVTPLMNNAVASVEDVTYGNESLIVVRADIDGRYQVDVNGTSYNLRVEDGVGNVSVALEAGIYYANLTFNNKNYITVAQNATFEVYKADINLSIEVPELVYPQDFKGTIHSNLDGKYNFSVDNYSTTVLVKDGVAQFDLGLLDAGTYRVSLNSSGNRNYNPASYTVFVTVNRALNNAVVTVEDVTYGNESLILIRADADGNYQVDVNGTIYNIAVRNGLGNRTIRLDAGDYYANLSFRNINYNTSLINDTFSVFKADIDLVVFIFDVFYPQDVEGVIYASVDGDYNLTVNNELTLISVKDNYAFFNKGTLNAGTYEANVSFAGNDNYNPAFNRISFTVHPSSTMFEIAINSSQFTYGNTATVTHILSEGATGSIKYFLSDGTFLGELSVDKNLTLPILDAGTYVLIANYSGDNNFISALDSLSFTVSPALNNAVVTVENVTYGNESIIMISADVDGIYQLDLNGTIYNVIVEDGTGNMSIGLNAGVYYANLTFNSRNYNTTAQNATFEVYKADINLTIEASDIVYPQELTGIVRSNLDGEYSFTVDGHTTQIIVQNGIYEFNLGILDAGSYQVTANYSGDVNHNPAGSSKSVTVSPGLNNANVTVSNVTYGENALIEVSADIDGTYQLDLNGTIYNLTVEDGTGNMSIGLNAGVYYANLTFDNKNYNTIAQNATFEVYKASVDIFVSAQNTVYPHEIEGVVFSDVDGEYKLTIGDYSSIVIVQDGRGQYNAGTFDAGNYTVTVTYPGDENHYSNSSSREVTVSKFTPDLSFNVSDIDYGDVAVISIACDIPGSVNVTVNGITETLNLNGQTKKRLFASILTVSRSGNTAALRLYNLDSGSYPLTVTYNGDNNIESVSLNGEFKVNALNVTMDIDANDINVGDDETITVKLSDNVTGNLTITVDGRNYTASVKDGKAIISIPGLSAGNKIAKAYYSGDRNHNPSTGDVSFEVNKVKPDMTGESDDPIYTGEKLHVIINLPSDARGTVTIAIDGKNYTSPVKDGKATFDISGLKAGRYDLTAHYSGDDKYEEEQIVLTVTVKDNGNRHNNHSHSDVSPNLVETNSTGNPIAVLLLALMTIGFTAIRRFKE